MYLIPILVLALVVIAGSVWSPIFALLIAVPLFVLFLAYVGLSRRADERTPRPSGKPQSGEGESPEGGVWGEKRA